MNKFDVLSVILNEKTKLDKIKINSGLLTQWYWNVGFRDIKINEDIKHITCIVSRPNLFIGQFRKPIVNFLTYITEKVFSRLGYTFELKKDTEDECYSLYKKYLEMHEGK